MKNLFYSCERRIRRVSPGVKEGTPQFNGLIAKELFRVLATQPRARGEPGEVSDMAPPPHDAGPGRAPGGMGGVPASSGAYGPPSLAPPGPPMAYMGGWMGHGGPSGPAGLQAPPGFAAVAVPGGYALVPNPMAAWPGHHAAGAAATMSHLVAGGSGGQGGQAPTSTSGFIHPHPGYDAPSARVVMVRTAAGPMHMFPNGRLVPVHHQQQPQHHHHHHQPPPPQQHMGYGHAGLGHMPPSPSPWAYVPRAQSPSVSSTATSPGAWAAAQGRGVIPGPYGQSPLAWTPPGAGHAHDPWAPQDAASSAASDRSPALPSRAPPRPVPPQAPADEVAALTAMAAFQRMSGARQVLPASTAPVSAAPVTWAPSSSAPSLHRPSLPPAPLGAARTTTSSRRAAAPPAPRGVIGLLSLAHAAADAADADAAPRSPPQAAFTRTAAVLRPGIATESLEPEGCSHALAGSSSSASLADPQVGSGISTGSALARGPRLEGRSAASVADSGMSARLQLQQALEGRGNGRGHGAGHGDGDDAHGSSGAAKRRRSARSSIEAGPAPAGARPQQGAAPASYGPAADPLLPQIRGRVLSARSAASGASSGGTPTAKRGRRTGEGVRDEPAEGGVYALPRVSRSPPAGADPAWEGAAPPTARGDGVTPAAGARAAPLGAPAQPATSAAEDAFVVRSKPSGRSEVLSIQEAIGSMSM